MRGLDLELLLLSKTIETGDIKTVVDHKITPNFFYGRGKIIYQKILEFYREYRKTPDIQTLKVEFPDFNLSECPEPIQFYVDKIRERHKHNEILKGLNIIADLLESDKINDAEQQLYRLASRLAAEIKISKDLDYAKDAEDRYQRYLIKKKHHGIDGIPTLIEPIDNVTGGAHKGELITILGQPGTGKTWFELVIARSAIREGYRVLFITKEMEPEQIATRMDAALLGLPFDKVRRGLLGDSVEDKYVELLKGLGDKYADFIISGDKGEGGVTEIQAKIEEHNPDLVIIDGSYLIIDEDGGKAMHERAMNVTRRLKRLALKMGLPIYNSSQAGRQVKRGTAPGMEDVAFSYAYAQDSDVIVSLYRTPEMEVASKLGVKLTKVRDGTNVGHYMLHWDFEDMSEFGVLTTDLTGESADEDEGVVIY